jgi:hypothetical protein
MLCSAPRLRRDALLIRGLSAWVPALRRTAEEALRRVRDTGFVAAHAMTWWCRHTLYCRTRESGYPVRRGLSIQSLRPLEYWVARSSRAMTTRYVSAFSRLVSPEVLKNLSPFKQEGAGNAGCSLHPRSRVHSGRKCAHEHTGTDGGNPTFPAQWLYGLYRALPGERLFCLRRALRSSCLQVH